MYIFSPPPLFLFFFFFSQAHARTQIQLQPHKANINVWKEASGHPVEISHLIALHLQVASVGFRQERSLLLKLCVVRIHKAGDAHAAFTGATAAEAWASQPPVIACRRA